ncbi:ADP-ribosylation factor-like protein 11 isoform X2 [Nematolebias whitei]|uniref:ADP-ribosylation factor-like protein 11 isoform X2 n=1 Tax=Nematolebias whitei TaxID=451745 RepID=UPI00189C5069|nr:ADP-ribosylation factor-like protein 11 isoform X2 [Nematolebias whitei]
MGQNSSSSYPQVILVGLDSAGKSTLLARLLTGKVMETSPTVGFNVGTLDLDKKTSLTVWDVGGQQCMRANWKYYLDDCKALVFVVDSSDPARMPEAQKALKKISTQLDLPSFSDRLWEIQACSAVQGLGLQQAFISVNKMIRKS